MRKILSFTAALLITGSALAGGEIWRWKDANGTWHYSDQPQAGAELVRRAGRATTESPKPAAPSPQAPSLASTSGSPVSGEVAAQVRQEAAAAKTEQCKKAEETYKNVIQARRISKKDEAGNNVFMSDAEIDAARLQARGTRDAACGPGA